MPFYLFLNPFTLHDAIKTKCQLNIKYYQKKLNIHNIGYIDYEHLAGVIHTHTHTHTHTHIIISIHHVFIHS